MLADGPPPGRDAGLLPPTQRYTVEASFETRYHAYQASEQAVPQADLVGVITGGDAFAELVRLAVQRDPSLAHSDTSAAARAATSAAGPPPDAATGAIIRFSCLLVIAMMLQQNLSVT